VYATPPNVINSKPQIKFAHPGGNIPGTAKNTNPTIHNRKSGIAASSCLHQIIPIIFTRINAVISWFPSG
jgi:hypothetical protein